MKYIKYLFLAGLAICLITVALANRQMVVLSAVPEDVSGLLGFSFSISVPLYVVIFAGILAGLLIGFVWEWLREHKHRAEAARRAREVGQLEREVKRLRVKEGEGKDEVLALLERPLELLSILA